MRGLLLQIASRTEQLAVSAARTLITPYFGHSEAPEVTPPPSRGLPSPRGNVKWYVAVCIGIENNGRKLTMSRLSEKLGGLFKPHSICDFCGATSPGLARFFVGLPKLFWRLLTSHGRVQQAVFANGVRVIITVPETVRICETCLRSFHAHPERKDPSLTQFTCSVCHRQREGGGFRGLHGATLCPQCVEMMASDLFKE
jgi:hypothetical protein